MQLGRLLALGVLAGSCHVGSGFAPGMLPVGRAARPGSSPASRCDMVDDGFRGVGDDDIPVTKIEMGKVPLGKRSISELGFGTIAWGDPDRGFGQDFGKPMVEQAFREMVEGGVTLIDTAEVYGHKGMEAGESSEQLVGSFLDDLRERDPARSVDCVAASKFFPVPWTNVLVGGGVRIGRQAVVDAARASSERLGRPIDLYQLHFPFPYLGGSDALCEGLAEAADLGLVKSVGVCNFERAELEAFHAALGRLGVPLVSNQVKFSLLDRRVAQSGLLDTCRELGVTVLAYEPLEGGLLTGKYHNGQHIYGPAPTTLFSQDELVARRPIVNLCRFIGTFDGGKTTAQVALNYLMSKGAVPIPGCKNVAQARELLGSCGWRLSGTDMGVLDERMDYFEKQSGLSGVTESLSKEIQGWLGGGGGGDKGP